MRVIYRFIWQRGARSEAEKNHVVLSAEQDWVPPVGMDIFFPDDTTGTVTDLEAHYLTTHGPAYVEVWVK